jgi:hypothetical protein
MKSRIYHPADAPSADTCQSSLRCCSQERLITNMSPQIRAIVQWATTLGELSS